MPLWLFQNGGFYFFAHSRLVQTLDGDLIRGVQTGLHLSVRRDADAVASRTEMGTHRADQPDFTQSARQAVQLRNASVRREGFQLRQLFQNNSVWYIGIRAVPEKQFHRC